MFLQIKKLYRRFYAGVSEEKCEEFYHSVRVKSTLRTIISLILRLTINYDVRCNRPRCPR
jgi:predicted secreted Zn-dependent protease